jgi:CRISPR-associated endonuclease Cas2
MIRMVTYDISENAARARVSDYLESQGFERVQYSVFLGTVDQHRWQKTWVHLAKLFAKHCAPTDKIFSIVVERDHFDKMSILGQDLDRAWILQEVPVFFA